MPTSTNGIVYETYYHQSNAFIRSACLLLRFRAPFGKEYVASSATRPEANRRQTMKLIEVPSLRAKVFALATCGLMLVACGLALAQSYSIDWFTIAGGGTSTNGQYSVSG